MVETAPALVEVYCETYMLVEVVRVLLAVAFASSFASALIFSAFEHWLYDKKSEK